ncbi:VCBS domain-containing protein, partial [Desulforhopalus vacuolatus]|uniref:VCBS domain-containing protein n=1 Tax=Desulforhopalus vacuolatus TaxID=40414 RepID=UPI001965CE70
ITEGELDFLAEGETVTAVFTITVDDQNGGTDTQDVTITITGANDAPVAGADITTTVAEGDATINGALTSTDLDDGATAAFAVTPGSTAPDGFILNPDGSYSFDPTDAAYDHLNVGDSTILTIPVTVTDDN